MNTVDTSWIREMILLPDVEVAPGVFGGAILLLVAGIVAWVLTGNTEDSNLAWIKQLVPAGGAQIWWSFFHPASPGTSGEGKETKENPANRKQLKRKLTSIGRFALRSEPVNPCVICFFVATSNERGKKALTAADLGHLMNERVLSKHERFRSRVSPADDRFFEDMTIQDPDQLVVEREHPHNIEELQNYLAEYLTTKFNVTERLWEAEISTGPMGSSGALSDRIASRLRPKCDRETVTIFRVHHALCDGVSLSVATGDLCDEKDKLHADIADLAEKRKLREAKRTLLERTIGLLYLIFFYTIGTIVALFRQFWRSLTADAPFDKVMKFRSEQGLSMAWRDIAPLAEVKQVAKAVSHSATVNDLFVACLAGALYRQLEEHKQVLEESGYKLKIPHYLNVTVPVHLTGGILLEGQSLGNRIGAFVTSIPRRRGNDTPKTWLKRVSRALYEGKVTPAPLVAWSFAKTMSYGPLALAKLALRHGHARSVAVISNIRGFPFYTHWAGHRLEHLYAFLPLAPGIPMGFVVQSYAGETSFSIEADRRAIPDATKFANWVVEEYETLKAVALTTDQNNMSTKE